MITSAIKGLKYFIEGFELITKPGLKRFVVIPALINMVFFIGFFFLFKHYVAEFNTWFDLHLPDWLQWLSIIIWLFFFAGFFVFFIYTFVIFANIFAAPFNSLLSEKVEWYLTGNKLGSQSAWSLIKDFPRVIGRQLNIIFYYLIRAVFILFLFFIPLMQPFVSVLWFFFSAWFIAMTYVDYPSDNHRVPIAEVRARLKLKPAMVLMFGASVLLASLVPGLNFFTIPAAVAGATKMWGEEFDLPCTLPEKIKTVPR